MGHMFFPFCFLLSQSRKQIHLTFSETSRSSSITFHKLQSLSLIEDITKNSSNIQLKRKMQANKPKLMLNWTKTCPNLILTTTKL